MTSDVHPEITLAEVSGELLQFGDEALAKYRAVQGFVPPHIIVPVPTEKQKYVNFDWHPYLQRFAFANPCNNNICIYDLKISAGVAWLQHDFQNEVKCIAWRPIAGSSLAVGCRHGICFWKLMLSKDSSSLATGRAQDQNSYMEFLQTPKGMSTNTLSWSPSGRYLSSGHDSPHVLIWDISMLGMHGRTNFTWTPLFPSLYGGVSSLSWSPDGNFLFAAGPSSCCLWETMTWKELFLKNGTGTENLNNSGISISWSKDSKMIAFSWNNTLWFYSIPASPPRVEAKPIQDIVFDRPIQQISWDTSLTDVTGRLVVSLQNDPHILLYSTVSQPVLTVHQIGSIKGPLQQNQGSPQPPKLDSNKSKYYSGRILSFHPNFGCGSLLSVFWENGKLAFYPMYYRAENKE